jgi:hypothetical protein
MFGDLVSIFFWKRNQKCFWQSEASAAILDFESLQKRKTLL